MSNNEFFNRFEGLTFDDVVVVRNFQDQMQLLSSTVVRDLKRTDARVRTG